MEIHSVLISKKAAALVCIAAVGFYGLYYFGRIHVLILKTAVDDIIHDREGWEGYLYLLVVVLTAFTSTAVFSVGLATSQGFKGAGLLYGSVGDTRTPVCCPASGKFSMTDNRTKMGGMSIAAMAVNIVLLLWKPVLFSSVTHFTLLYSLLVILAVSVAFYTKYLRSNWMYYRGMFPRQIPILASMQLALFSIESFHLYCSPSHTKTHLGKHEASNHFNCLIGGLFTSAILIVLLLSIQQRPYYSRVLESSSDKAETLVAYEYRRAVGDGCTPLAYPRAIDQNNQLDSPEHSVSFLSRLTFSWFNKTLETGVIKHLGYEDMFRTNDNESFKTVWPRFTKYHKKNRSLLASLVLTLLPELATQCVLSAFVSALQYSGPFFLKRILHAIENVGSYDSASESANVNGSYQDIVCLLICTLLTSIFTHQTGWIGQSIGRQVRGILICEITRKSLSRSRTKYSGNDGTNEMATNTADSGRVIGLLTSDTRGVTDISTCLDAAYTIPFKLALGIWFMYSLLGSAIVAGVPVLLLFMYISRLQLKGVQTIDSNKGTSNDKRITTITELLQGIKAVKLFGWVSRFVSRIDKLHESQLEYKWQVALAWMKIHLVSSLSPAFVLATTLAVYVIVQGNKLSAEVVFTSISVFKMIRGISDFMPQVFSWATHGYHSLLRIESFLDEPDLQRLEDRVGADNVPGSNEIGFVDAVLSWGSVETKADSANVVGMPCFTLKNLSLRFPAGGLSLIAGPTGSGKSSLLLALIGEMTLTSGRILLPTARTPSTDPVLGDLTGSGLAISDIAYVAQEAWLRNATIRENILFGEPYSQQRYEEVLRVCSLKPDLRILTAGDMTEIGERGVTLSGGQKQRVALARAVYSSRRILLIDDCLSAVDTHTAKHILSECLVGKTPLMQGRTRVLVTHHVSLCLPFAQHVVMLREGEIMLQGAPGELQASGAFSDVIAELEKNNVSPDAEDDEQSPKSTSDNAAETSGQLKTEDSYNDERLRLLAEQKDLNTSIDAVAIQGMLVEDEERKVGMAGLETWQIYLAACGGTWFWVAFLLLDVIAYMFPVIQDHWVRMWVAASKHNSQQHSAATWLGMYIVIGLVGAVFGATQSALAHTGGIRASSLLHARLLRSVTHAQSRFFDSTPLGRILSRFSGDMETVGDVCMDAIGWLTSDIVAILRVFTIVGFMSSHLFAVACGVALFYVYIGHFYLCASREIKRLDSNGWAPLLSLFSELTAGSSSIRAFSFTGHYTKEAFNRLSVQSTASYSVWASYRWLSVRVDASSAIIAFGTALFILANRKWIDPGLAGFVMSYALSFPQRVAWAILNCGINEQNITAVERISQYFKVDQEAVLHSLPGNEPPTNWPSSGETVIEDLVVEYVPDTPVLHGISLRARHGEKIGVVGRTGAGKSTLSLALMRFIEAKSGRVLLDGVDISQIGLEELRRNVTIIPQDPVLFNGTIRFNLDPFDEYSDEYLWKVLGMTYLTVDNRQDELPSVSDSAHSKEQAYESKHMAGIFNSLNNEIKENGQNLSLGQRQLVALARALIRCSRLVIMDEATASVDFDTDSRIQRTIRGSEFTNSTLFCVAHRLRTIIDYDRVLVLDKGKVVEFDTPSNLLQKSDGIFKGMCEQSGEYDQLVKLASAHT